MILPRWSQRTALMGRMESQRPLPSQAQMLASSSALLRAKNSLASSSTVLASRRATHWANWFQCPGRGDCARPVLPVLGHGLAGVVQLLGVLGHLVDLIHVLAARLA